MVLRKLIFLSALLACTVSVFANEFVVKSFEKIENDLAARRYERKDVNDIPCAIIKIRTDISKPFVFDANLGIEGSVDYQDDNEIWVYVSDGERQLTIARDGFVTLKYSLPQMVKKSTVYSLVLRAKENKVSVVIISNPPDAEKFIDGKLLGTGSRFDIEIGLRQLEVRKTGYRILNKSIAVSKEKSLFQDLKLIEIEPIEVTLKSNPTGATIYINNVAEGETNKQLLKFPGEYSLRISKNNYETISKSIQVTELSDNRWTFELLKSTAILTLKTTPSNAAIFLNGERKTTKSQELAPGRYRIEVKLEGWELETRTITIEKGQNQTQFFTLIQKTGKLQVVVGPMEAKVVLIQGSREMESWIGTMYKKSVPVGDYTVQISLPGYVDETRSITVEDGKTGTLDITLKPQTVTGLSESSPAESQPGTVTDIDGNVYKTVRIGNQVWMAENLKVTHYRNGDRILTGYSNSQWSGLSTGAYCYYDNNRSKGEIYGALYNWYAINDSRKIAPKGWHVPSDAEWLTLTDHYGGFKVAGGKLKEAGTIHWNRTQKEATNESGFNALPGGKRSNDPGGYHYMGLQAHFWSATNSYNYRSYSKSHSSSAYSRTLRGNNSQVSRSGNHAKYGTTKRSGFSVRLLRD
jgi:uncharacterized protein (TIGR02145 family)